MMGGKAQGNLPGLDWGGAMVLSIKYQSPLVNLRQSLQVSAWNILSLREDEHMSLSSDLCKAFNLLNGNALWRILGLCRVPPKLIDLIF